MQRNERMPCVVGMDRTTRANRCEQRRQGACQNVESLPSRSTANNNFVDNQRVRVNGCCCCCCQANCKRQNGRLASLCTVRAKIRRHAQPTTESNESILSSTIFLFHEMKIRNASQLPLYKISIMFSACDKRWNSR